MLSSTLWGAFATPVTYVLMFILLGTAVMQIRYVNKALQRFDSTQVIPIQFVMFTLCVILGSAVLYRDFEETTAEQARKFVGGCLLTFFGVFLITSGRDHHHEDEDTLSEAEGVEETIGLAHQDGYHDDDDDDYNDDNDVNTVRNPHDSVTPSRRSSRLSRVEFQDPVRPHSPCEPDVPSLRFVGAGSTPSSLVQDAGSYFGPWSSQSAATPPSGRGVRTMSADTLMRGSAVVSTPNRLNLATPVREGQASTGNVPDQPVTPQARANTYGPGQHHRSGTFISPSPLASTVTTVMKDGFLRNDKKRKTLASKSSMRHIRSRIRASLFFNEDEQGHQFPASDSNLLRGLDEQEVRPGPGGHPPGGMEDSEERGRARSLSDTLGDLFKPKPKRRKDEAHTDVERGEGPDTQPGPST